MSPTPSPEQGNRSDFRNVLVSICLSLMDDRGVEVRVSLESRIVSTLSRRDLSRVDPTSYLMGTGGFPLGVKRPGREANHSPITSAEVKKI
jgi:hypothetical protein